MIDYVYRVWLLSHLIRLLAIPQAIFFLGFRLIHFGFPELHLSYPIKLLLYVLGPPIFWLTRRQMSRWADERKAHTAGARLPPIISGKEIGNIDLMRR